MKQESSKKSKLWLWLTIGAVALAAIVALVLALVLGGSGQSAGKSADGRPELYWNVDRSAYTENSESGLSTREPGEDGLYHIRFAIDGEHVELAVADKQLVNYIDVLDVMALTVDSDGIIVDVQEPDAVATVVGKSIYAQQIGEDGLTANSSLAMNGMKHEITLTDLTQIYEVSGKTEPVGQITDLAGIQPLDTLGVYANGNGEVTHIFIMEHPEQSKIYWRAEQFYNSKLKETTRVPDENGVYSMDFYCEGELVTLKTRDKLIVNHVDSRDRYACSRGFLFDEEGYVVGEIDTALGSRTVLGCERFDVTEITDGTVYTEKLWNPDGSVYSCKLAEDCVIYDVSTAALAEGRRGLRVDSLQVGDRVTIWANTNGEAAIVYVACRTVDVDTYYIPTRKYDSTLGQTTRQPDSEGWYEVELLKVGETANRTFKTKDKDLMSYLDSMTSRTAGLIVNGDVIERVYDSECIFGYTPLTRGGTVPTVTGSIFTRMTYGSPDSTRTSVMASECKVYNVSEVGQYGAETTLQPYDRIYAHKQPTGEAVCIFVTQRRVGLDHLYWNVGRQYDSDAKTTTRVPDADGWYIFEMIHQGKQVTLKTKSKAIASKIDAQSSCAIGLDVSGDVIVSAYSALNTSGGSVTMSGYRVKEIRDDGVITVYYGSGDTYKERMFKIKADGVIYNVSDAYYSYRGEQVSSLKVGDMVLVVTDIYAEAEVVYIRYREADNMYWRTDRYYDTVNKVTTRVPDAQGWYHYDLAVNGTIKSFKTKDKELATKLDAVSGAFGLVVDGDVIRSYVPTNWVRNVGFVGVTNWEVTAISGRQVTVKYTLPGSSNTGKTQTITLASGAKIYDVSPTAESFGAAAKLKVGDQIRTYQDESNTNQLYVYILHRANRVQGIDGYCEHCDKTVHWNPYAGGSITRASGHYYLSGDCQTTEQLGVGLENSDYEIVLDLNGKTLTRLEGGRFALVRYGDTLTVLDSVGGGAVKSYGAERYNGGVMYVDGGKLNLLGGTLELMDSEFEHKWGGVLYLSESTFKMSGGTVVGGTAQRGGSIYNTGASVIEMSGGTVTGGTSTEGGGNIYLVSESTMKMSGGTVSNGYAGTRSGNIHVDTATLEITGGTVTGGSSARSDDGICVNSSKSSVKLENVNCEDKILVRYMGEFVLGGSVKIAQLEIPKGKVFTVGEMTQGAEVYVNTIGVFTKEFDNAQAYAEAGYFKSAQENMEVGVSGNALSIVGGKKYCAHCDQKVTWTLWSADATIEGTTEEGKADHYYIDGDFTNHTKQRTVRGNVVLDLRGNDYTTSGIRNFLVSGNFSIVDSVGGGTMTADGDGKDGSIAYVNGDAGVFSLYGGTLKLSENGDVNNGGVIAVNRGSVNVYGGQIIGGTVSNNGSAIWNSRYADIAIQGGTITGSVYTVGSADNQANLAISGGTVNGAVQVGSNVETTVSGAPVLTNLDLTGGKLITLGELTEGADITVTAAGVFTNENEKAADYANYFKSLEGEHPTAENNVLSFGSVQTPDGIICPHCNTEVEWTVWPGTTKPASGHYYIDGDFTAQTAQWTISSGTDVVLDLRGNDYTTTGIRNFLVSGEFSIVDTAGGGSMSADGAGNDGSIAYINGAAGSFSLYGGTLKQGQSPNVNNGGILAANRGQINILGGEIIGGTVTADGSAIWNKRHVALTVENATITGSVYIVGDDESNASLSVKDSTVTGDVLVGEKVDVTVSGKAVISNLDLTGGKLIALGELTAGADITVTADDGAFTAENANAADYVTYFKATGDKAVTVEADKLVMGDKTADPDPETFDCPHCDAENVEWKLWPGTTAPASGHYYIESDFTAQAEQWTIAAGTDVVLDLRGNSYAPAGIRLFLVKGDFSVVDSVGGGVMSADGSNQDGTIAYISTNATFNLYGGTLQQGSAPSVKNGGILAANKGHIGIYGGTVTGGTITGDGSALWNKNYGNITIDGGTVTGSVYAVGTAANKGNVTISGGTVTGDVQVGDNVNVTVSGNPVLSNLDLTGGKVITLGEMETGADITVTADDGIFTEENAKAADYAQYFKVAVETKMVYAEGNALLVGNWEASPYNRVYAKAAKMTADGVFGAENANADGVVTADCPYCGAEGAQWEKLQSVSERKMVTGTHHYYLADDLETNTYYYYFGDGNTTAEGAAICLHLNGHSIKNTVADTSNDARAIYVETDATLNIMGDGTVSGACKQTTRGAVDVRGTLNLCGGNYLSTSTKYPVIQMRHADCVVNVFKGAAVGAEGMTATGIYLQTGTLNIYGGTFCGVTEVLANTAVSLAGAPVIAQLKLAEGVTATLGQMADGADITVNAADGAFTGENAKAADYAVYFKAADAGKTVKAEGDALCITDATAVQFLKNLLKALCANLI